MYAHQVIDNIDSDLKTHPENEHLQYLRHLVLSSQKFNIPDFDKIDTSNIEKEQEIKENLYDIMPPFHLCWFDYASTKGIPCDKNKIQSPKRGVLTQHEGDFVRFMTFNFFGEDIQRWIFPIVTTVVNLKTKKWSIYQIPTIKQKLNQSIINYVASENAGDRCHVMQVLSILNCKNISTIDNYPPSNLNKKRVRNHKQPLFTYKTLIIKPTGKKQSNIAPKSLWDNRVHLCRGHFKTYTEENPLFGKFTGRYWWQPHARGDKTKGVVMKDYKVETGFKKKGGMA